MSVVSHETRSSGESTGDACEPGQPNDGGYVRNRSIATECDIQRERLRQRTQEDPRGLVLRGVLEGVLCGVLS